MTAFDSFPTEQERRARAALFSRSVANVRASQPPRRGRGHFDASGAVVILAAPLPRPRPARSHQEPASQESQPGATRSGADSLAAVIDQESHQEPGEQERPGARIDQESQPGATRIDAGADGAVIDASGQESGQESHQEPATDQERRAALLVRLAVETEATTRIDRRPTDSAARLLLSLVAPAHRASVRPRHNERIERITTASAAGTMTVTFYPLRHVGTEQKARVVLLSPGEAGLFTVGAEFTVPMGASR